MSKQGLQARTIQGRTSLFLWARRAMTWLPTHQRSVASVYKLPAASLAWHPVHAYSRVGVANFLIRSMDHRLIQHQQHIQLAPMAVAHLQVPHPHRRRRNNDGPCFTSMCPFLHGVVYIGETTVVMEMLPKQVAAADCRPTGNNMTSQPLLFFNLYV